MSKKEELSIVDDVELDDDEDMVDDPKKQRTGIMKCLCNNLFMITIIIGVIIGFGIGFGLRELPEISETLKVWVGKFPFTAYLNSLCFKCLINCSINFVQ